MSSFDALYADFEDCFRGSHEEIKKRLEIYGPLLDVLPNNLKSHYKAVDIGCGRGEWLEVLTDRGFRALGTDTNAGMRQAASVRSGFEVEAEDGLVFMTNMPNESASVISAFHLVEHVPLDYLLRLLKECERVLADGGLLILETPNPESLSVGAHTFHMDPTHVKPLPPKLLQFLVRKSGFSDVEVLRLNGPSLDDEAGDFERSTHILLQSGPDYACLAQKHGGADTGPSSSYLLQFTTRYSQPNPSNIEFLRQLAQSGDESILELRNGIQGLNKRIEEIENSITWRITLPILRMERMVISITHSAKNTVRKALEHCLSWVRKRPVVKKVIFLMLSLVPPLKRRFLRFAEVRRDQDKIPSFHDSLKACALEPEQERLKRWENMLQSAECEHSNGK